MTQHQKDKLYKCNQCEKGFYFKSVQRKHISIDHENLKHMCNECGKEFVSFANLSHHIKTVHNNVNTFKCALCKAKFKTRNKIKQHVQLHGRVNLFQCSICGEKLKMAVQVCTHRSKVHNSEPDVLKMDIESLNLLEEKLMVKIKPEPNECSESQQRTRNAQPFLAIL